MSHNELHWLVEIGVLTPVQQLQYGTLIFIIPKNKFTVRFITDYWYLNQKVVRKSHAFPKIGKTIQQLEGFCFATWLYLNMGYYTINTSPEICNLTTIVTEFGKFRYNIAPMGLCASSDTFKAKVDKIIGCIESVKTYINNIIVLGKGILYQQ